MKLIQPTIILSLLAISLTSLAAPEWKEPMAVGELRTSIGARTEVLFYRENTLYTPCPGVHWYWFEFSGSPDNAVLRGSDTGKEIMNSYLLTAYVSNSAIGAVIDCTDNQIYEIKLRR